MSKNEFLFKYKMNAKICSTPTGSSYCGYGIKIINKTNNSIVKEVEDISLSKSEISKLVDLCNRHQLDPIHIDDVIEDFIG